MKTTTIAILTLALAACLGDARAQTTNIPYAAATAAAPTQRLFNQEELDQMLAPVSLYPDSLLSQMLMAATYPLEVVEAERWAQQHSGLSGTQLSDALAQQPWDASVKSLCAFPQILERMNKDLSWTQELGNAFLDQRQQVMDSVQNLRRQAQAAGALRSNRQQQVVVAGGDIAIEPANPQVVYVPTYDPAVVYGSWWWPGYPPYYPAYWGPPSGALLDDGFFWGIGVDLALWGGFDWRRHDVHIDADRYNHFNGTHISDDRWHHDPAHRGDVPYRGETLHMAGGEEERRFSFHGSENMEHRGESIGPRMEPGHSFSSFHGMARGGGAGHGRR